MTQTQTTAPAESLHRGGILNINTTEGIVKASIGHVRFYRQSNIDMARVYTDTRPAPFLVRVTGL